MAIRSARPATRLPAHTMALQAFHMRLRWPQFTRSGNARASIWRGQLQPTDCSISYGVSVGYRLGGIPTVRVLTPALHLKAPHRYGDGSLCLYWPEEWRWHGHRLIAETILPWTCHWLYLYELWQVTGEWLGPSAPHSPEVKGRDDR